MITHLFVSVTSDNFCVTLTDPLNGQVSMTGTAVGDQATYTCDDTFILEGDAVRTCQRPGFWTGAEPFCRGTFARAILLS